jgi:hypothetical protein
VKRPRVLLGGLVLTVSALGGCLLVESFGGYETDGGGGDAARDVAARDAVMDGSVGDAVSDAPIDTSCTPDTSSDPRNCGQCGHDCFGGPCTNSRCGPIQVATGASPFGLAVTSAGVYFTGDSEAGTIYLWNPDSDAGAVVVATGQDQPSSIAASGHDVYWTSHSGILTCRLGKAPCDPTPLEAGGTVPTNQVTATEDYVCWTASDAGTLTCTPLSDGGATTHLKGLIDPGGLGIVAPNMYFTNRAYAVGAQGSIDRFDVDRGLKKASSFVQGLTSPERVAFNPAGNIIYWTEFQGPDGGAGAVKACDIDTDCTPTILASVDHALGIVVDRDNTYVYFVSNTPAGYVYACPTSLDAGMCNLTAPLASKQQIPSNIGQDTTSLYWTDDRSSGSLMRIAKPLPP